MSRLSVQTDEENAAQCASIAASSSKFNAKCKMLVKPFIPDITEFLKQRNRFARFYNKKVEEISDLLPNMLDSELDQFLTGKFCILAIEHTRKRIKSYEDNGTSRRRLQPPKIFYDFNGMQWKKKTRSLVLDEYVDYVLQNVEAIENVTEKKMKKGFRKQISACMNEIFAQIKEKEKENPSQTPSDGAGSGASDPIGASQQNEDDGSGSGSSGNSQQNQDNEADLVDDGNADSRVVAESDEE